MSKFFPLKKWHAVQSVVTGEDLGKSEKLTYIRLAYYHNSKTGACYPSVPRVAADIGLSGRTVRLSLRRLEKAGYIETHQRSGRNGTNAYDLKIPTGKSTWSEPEEMSAPVRKPDSSKQMNRTNEKNRDDRKTKSATEPPLSCPSKERAEATRNRQDLQNALVERLGKGEVAWNLLLDADQDGLRTIEDAWMKDELSMEEAVINSLKLVGKQ